MRKQYDVIVVGAGHAGCEAALAAARLGCKVLLVTISLDMIAYMPCNPSVGGPAKGQVVREIDALGGVMGQIVDQSYVQLRMLNTGKGPAVYALRAQVDKSYYQQLMRQRLEAQPNLYLVQAMVERLLVQNGKCVGVRLQTGQELQARAVVLTTGTYLRGKVIVGDVAYASGPNNQQPSVTLAKQLAELNLQLYRFKTGTPPRLHRRSINFEAMQEQPGDEQPKFFSYQSTIRDRKQVPCFLTYTNSMTHQVILNNLHRAPLYTGKVEGSGPRYCPSIEDKVVRFKDRERHQVFIEPEGLFTEEIYVQGLSTSLPEDVQEELLHTISGLEAAEVMRTGYAIEYDVLDPLQLTHSLAVKRVLGLYTAGQLNGTSGYEEAAGQGLVAGINAARATQGHQPLVLDRSEAYIGVMIDDLVTKGTTEPYRLLTSRAEHRLFLRHDNADLRLAELGQRYSLLNEERYQQLNLKKKAIHNELTRLKKEYIVPSESLNSYLENLGEVPVRQAISLATLLKRPGINYEIVIKFLPNPDVTDEVAQQVEFELKYEGYIAKAKLQIERMQRMEEKKIPNWVKYEKVPGLANEAREKLEQVNPISIGQAARIPGVNPSDLSVLLIYMEQKRRGK
ncbi:MAG: hypothetical protein RLZ12_1010 [Bacillota bacterium]